MARKSFLNFLIEALFLGGVMILAHKLPDPPRPTHINGKKVIDVVPEVVE